MEEKEEIIVSPKIIFEVLRKNLVFIIITHSLLPIFW